MMQMRTEIPAENSELRQALYSGQIFRLSGVPGCAGLVATVLAMLQEDLGDDCRRAQFCLSREQFLDYVSSLKQRVYGHPAVLETVQRIISCVGFELRKVALDPPRFRAVIHDGHKNPKAGPAYSPHRDTWYGNPQAQINWWIPLHDLTEAETFLFYPEVFAVPVPNSSLHFRYDEWIVQVGFGRSYLGNDALYPTIEDTEQLVLNPMAFSCGAGDVILFSGTHLHGTRENSSGLTRFSLDFRTVHLEDEAQGIGAPNVDNKSQGSALKDYVHPQ